MNLVFYSGGQAPSNSLLHDAVSQLALKRSKSRSLTYIPFTSDGALTFFQRAARRYSRFGFKKFYCLPADLPMDQNQMKTCLKSDVIYLAGGNTFYFLHHLRQSGLLPELRQFARRGGVLAGLSAGAILMTPTIGLAGYPSFECDDNEVGLKNLKSLNLVQFEIYPHHSQSGRLKKALEIYSRRTGRAIYGIPDGGGMVVENGKRTFYGKVTLYHDGYRVSLA